jgi:hypothetical protein
MLIIMVELTLFMCYADSIHISQFVSVFIKAFPLICRAQNYYGIGYLPFSIILLATTYFGLISDQYLAEKIGNRAIHLIKQNYGSASLKNIQRFGNLFVYQILALFTFIFSLAYTLLCIEILKLNYDVPLRPYPLTVLLAVLACNFILPFLVFITDISGGRLKIAQ